MKNRAIQRILAIALCCFLTVTMTPAAFAASSAVEKSGISTSSTDKKAENIETKQDENGKAYTSKVTIDPFTYYDVGGGASKQCDDELIRSVVKNNLLSDYAKIANGIWKYENDDCVTQYHKTFEEKFNKDNSDSDCWCDIRKYLSVSESLSKGKRKTDRVSSTGLCITDSLADVRKTMCKEIAGNIDRYSLDAEDLEKRGADSEAGTLPEMNDSSNTTAIYNIVTSINCTSEFKYVYNSFGLCFYDFKLEPLEAEGLEYHTSADGHVSPVAAAKFGVKDIEYDESEDVSVNSTTNDSAGEVKTTLNYGSKQSCTSSTEFTEQKGVSTTNQVGISVNWGAKAAKTFGFTNVSLNYNFTRQTSLHQTTKTGTSQSITNEKSQTTSVTLPPYTSVPIKSTKAKGKITLPFDVPVQISYKAAVFSMTGDVYADSVTLCAFRTLGYQQGYYLNILGNSDSDEGCSANENLYRRSVANMSTGRKDTTSGLVHRWRDKVWGDDYNTTDVGTDWSKFKKSGERTQAQKDEYEALVNQRTNIPMLSNGGKAKVEADLVNTEIGELRPLYNLSKVSLEKGQTDYTMIEGEKLDIDALLSVKGYNGKGGEYYGFNAKQDGDWVICDKDGKEISSSLAVLETGSDGSKTLKTKASGKVYLTWKLNEGAKYTCDNDSSVIDRNSNISLPVIEIIINKEPFKGSVEITGSYTGAVGDDWVNLKNSLGVSVMDPTGKKVKRPYIWEAKELSSDGITVKKSGKVKFTKAGTYHVRAVVSNTDSNEDDVRSDWYEIKAGEERVLSSLSFSDDGSDTRLMASGTDSEITYDLSSYLQGKDQYGEKWEGDLGNVKYALNSADIQTASGNNYATLKTTSDEDNQDTVSLDGDLLKITGEGTYKAMASTDKIQSDDFQVNVEDNLDIEETALSMPCGKQGRLVVTDSEDKTLKDGVKFTADDPTILTVSDEGIIDALKTGATKITAMAADGSTDTCGIIVTRGYQKLKVKGAASKKTGVKHLKKHAITTMPLSVTGAKTAVTYSKASGSSRLKVDKKTGKITIKKGTKKGTYRIKVKVTAKATADYAGAKATRSLKVIVK